MDTFCAYKMSGGEEIIKINMNSDIPKSDIELAFYMDFYTLLGCSPAATSEEIRKGYLKRMRKYHPDKFNHELAANLTARIVLAYETLSDDVERYVYDTEEWENDSRNYRLTKAAMRKRRCPASPEPEDYMFTMPPRGTFSKGVESDDEPRQPKPTRPSYSFPDCWQAFGDRQDRMREESAKSEKRAKRGRPPKDKPQPATKKPKTTKATKKSTPAASTNTAQQPEQSKPKKQREAACKWWHFRWNNPRNYEQGISDIYNIDLTDDRTFYEYVFGLLYDHFGVSYMAGQAEIGEEGTPHYQAALYFKTKVRLSTILNIKLWGEYKVSDIPEMYFQKAKKIVDNINYCTKSDSRIDGPFYKGVRPFINDTDEWGYYMELAKAGKLDDIPEVVRVRYFKTWDQIRDQYKPPSVPLNYLPGEWWTGPSGSGKSFESWKLYPEHYSKSCTKWWCNYKGEDVVVIQDFKPVHAKEMTHFLDEWCDHYPFNAEYKGGMYSRIRPKKIIVTSRYTIDQIWGLGDDSQYQSIKRRFPIIKQFPQVNDNKQ